MPRVGVSLAGACARLPFLPAARIENVGVVRNLKCALSGRAFCCRAACRFEQQASSALVARRCTFCHSVLFLTAFMCEQELMLFAS